MANQDNRHHCYLSTILSVRIGVPRSLSSGKIHWYFSNFKTTGKRLLPRMSMHLAELIFPSTSVIEPTPSLQIHPKTLDTRAPPLRLPNTVLNTTCTTFLLLFTIHTLVNFSLDNTTFHQKIWFYSIFLVLSSVVYFGTIAHDFFYFQRNRQCFRNNSPVKAINYSIVFELTFYKSELEQTD